MFTLAKLIELGFLKAWSLPDAGLPHRNFYYTQRWLENFNMLPTARAQGLSTPASVGERLAGLIDHFVAGTPKARLVRPQGDGMDPVFKRMRKPHHAIVEMRTADTRTFGIMGRRDTFVAMTVDMKKALLAVTQDGRDGYQVHAEACQQFLARISADDIDCESEIDDIIVD